MPPSLDTSFDRRYDCEWSDLPPGGRHQILIPPSGGGHSLAVRFAPWEAEDWVGVFAGGGMVMNSGLYTTPRPPVACVVAEGEGWLVDTTTPNRHERVDCTPVLHVVPVPSRGLLVFGNHTDLLAYTAEGVAWRSDRIGYSELEITEITDAAIAGVTPSVPGGPGIEFEVDLATGRHTGGPFADQPRQVGQ